MSTHSPKHRADSPVRTGSMRGYTPKHCAGGNGCTGHDHADDKRCRCRRTIIPADAESVTTEIRSIVPNKPMIPTRHSAAGCHVVTASSKALAR